MKIAVIVAIAVVAVIIIAVAIYFLLPSKSSPGAPGIRPTENPEEEGPETFK